MNTSVSSPALSSALAPQSFSYLQATHEDVMEDLSSRFILNLPEEELSSLERVCFQVEQAHWFYEDFIREQNPNFPSLPLKKFSAMLFHACPLLQEWSQDHERAFNEFMQYKTRVPVCGAIMLNESWDKCVLVKGWKSSSGWGFPKGKINELEPEHQCAAREVLEETGYNIANQINPENVIRMSIKEQKISLYIVHGVPEDFPFETRTRKEISKIAWFKLKELPTWQKNKAVPGKFYLISPFIGALKAFIRDRRTQSTPTVKAKANVPLSDYTSNAQAFRNKTHRTQLSDSQSSSTDHFGPVTPSPVGNPALVHVSTEKNGMDPHFARLFKNLALSESKTQKPQKMTLTLTQPSRDEPIVSATPVPPTASCFVSEARPRSEPDLADWSSQVPPSIKDRAMSMSTAPTSAATQAFLLPTETHYEALARTPTHPAPSSLPSISQSSSSADLAVSSCASFPLRPSSSIRTPNTTDLSPYLPQSSPAANGRELKRMALLESVADESYKMSQQTQHHRMMSPAGAYGVNGSRASSVNSTRSFNYGGQSLMRGNLNQNGFIPAFEEMRPHMYAPPGPNTLVNYGPNGTYMNRSSNEQLHPQGVLHDRNMFMHPPVDNTVISRVESGTQFSPYPSPPTHYGPPHSVSSQAWHPPPHFPAPPNHLPPPVMQAGSPNHLLNLLNGQPLMSMSHGIHIPQRSPLASHMPTQAPSSTAPSPKWHLQDHSLRLPHRSGPGLSPGDYLPMNNHLTPNVNLFPPAHGLNGGPPQSLLSILNGGKPT